MNNRLNNRSVTDQTATKQPFSIGDAADRLGMTSEAVRMRLKRGTLQGEKIDGRWIVYLDDATPAPTPPPERDQTTDSTPTEQTPKQATKRDQAETIAAKDETIDYLRSDNLFLRSQVESLQHQMAVERERFDVIHREALHRIEALTAGMMTPTESDTTETATSHVESPQNRPGAEKAVAMTHDTLRQPSMVSDVINWVKGLFG